MNNAINKLLGKVESVMSNYPEDFIEVDNSLDQRIMDLEDELEDLQGQIDELEALINTSISEEEIRKLKDDIEDRILELTKTKKEPVMLELYYDFGKGTGRAWVAEVDKKTKKILKFLDAESNVKEETYRGYKVFLINKYDVSKLA